MRWPLTIGMVLVFSLSGCTAPQLLKGTGVPADAPTGYITNCAKNPDQKHCKP